ncbi:MAG: Matrixin, partial [Planctomycetaceae bacterium]|nr:Matrixin [Planctomycetaceae bacterium]
PIGLGGHFPPNINATPTVDLFGIENTNRDSIDNYPDGGGRFDAMYIAGQEIDAPGSYGLQSGLEPTAQPRGIATLPGGIPLYRDTADPDSVGDTLVGGIGVFFPGTDGYATYEQGFVQGDGKSTTQRINAPKALEAEFIAFVAAGGSRGAGIPVGAIAGTPAVPGLDLPFAQINLAGITLQGVGPTAGIEGAKQLKAKFIGVLGTGANSGTDQMVTPTDQYLAGQAVPSGWLVAPHAAADGSLTAADVTQIVQQGITEANRTRAAIRELPTLGQRTKMVFAVTDKTGEVLGLYRMPDSAYFSLDVAVAKARNVTYYADPAKLQTVDKISSLPAGTALTSRTFRFLAEPRFPSGVDGSKPPPFSILNEVNPTTHQPLINKKNAENIGPAAPADWFQTVFGHDAFNIGTNFRDTSTPSNLQNGVVFFPGSTPLYKNGKLVGGLGVSGDGVDQDDGVTSAASTGFTAPSGIRADRYSVNGVRLPYFKFVRNPYG